MSEPVLPGGPLPEREPPGPVSPKIASRRDRLSIWSIILILLFYGMQALSMTKWQPPWSHHTASSAETVSRTALASDADFQELFGIDYQAKLYYLEQYTNHMVAIGPGQATTAASRKTAAKRPAEPAPKTLRPAPGRAVASAVKPNKSAAFDLPTIVKTAVAALRSHPKDVDFANRVILLRAQAGQPPLAPIPAAGKNKGLASPLAAFAPDPGMTPKQAALLNSESTLWSALFSKPTLGPNDHPAALARRIRALPNLHWYVFLALHQLYLRAGNAKMAASEQDAAERHAVGSVLLMITLFMGVMALMICGVAFLVLLIVGGIIVYRQSNAGQQPLSPFTRWVVHLGRPLAAPVPDENRRLGAGDLMDVFVFYIISGVAIGYLFQYLAAGPWHGWIESLSYNHTIDFIIIAEFVAYVGNGLLALGFLWLIARRRGASIGAELGLNSLRLGHNALFGLAGWSMGLGFMIVLGELSQKVFQRAPEPTNPAVALIVDAPGLLSHLLLFALASLAAPFFEETFFRGVFFNAARLRLGPWPAIILTGLVFGFAHPVGVGQAIPLATLGAVLAWMAYTRKSLAPSMTAHFLQNTFATSLMWLAFSARLPF